VATDESVASVRPAAEPVVPREVWRIAIVVILGGLMSSLDTTIVNIALDSLSHDLHTSLDDVQWVVTSYLLALAAVIPVTPWAARRFGAKRLYLTSIVLFTVGSALCGMATSTGELVVFRVIQGVGGGMILPVGQMIVVRAAGARSLVRVMGAVSVPIVLAPVLGPTVGGFLLDNAGWRWIFYVNVPIGILTVLAGLRRLPAEPAEDAGPFDLLGLGVAAGGLVALTYGLAEVGVSSGHIGARAILPLAIGVALVTAFVIRARRMDRPLMDVRLYANKAYSAASVSMFFFGAALYGGMILLPLYYQSVRYQDAVYTGLLVAPRGIGAAIGTWLSGRATEWLGAGRTSAIGGVICLASTLPFVMIGVNTSYALISIAMLIGGFGIGLATMPVMTTAYRSLRPQQINDATPQLNIIIRVGGSIGTALLTVVLQQQLDQAGSSLPAQAAAFGTTFWWLFGLTAVAVVPTGVLVLMERRQAVQGRQLQSDPGPAQVSTETAEIT
jgi:EmrB/QacA subfamily drug resistance transporter